MDLIGKKVKIINKKKSKYNMIGFCRECIGPDICIVELEDGLYTFTKKEIAPLESPKSLLKSGDLVIDEYGRKYRAFLEYEDLSCNGALVDIKENGYWSFDFCTDDLIYRSPYDIFNIEKIYTPKMPLDYLTDDLTRYNLKWSRKKIKQMTLEEVKDALGLTQEDTELIII